MIIPNVKWNRNDEWYTPEYAIEPILKYLKPNSTIWCPFDTEESLYVKRLRQEGHKVIHTHIANNQDFFELDIDCDYIISNPPYSKKTEVLDRLYQLKKPFAMLLGIVGIFERRSRFDMFKNNKFEIMYFNKRIKFYRDYKETKPNAAPPFSTAYVCHNILPAPMMFEEICLC